MYARAMVKKGPWEALEALRSSLPPGTPGTPGEVRSESARAPATAAKVARAVVRMERKGRGGKEVTVVEKLGLAEKELETWCRELKQALGCGGAIDGDTIVLQGDLRTRIPAVLTARGVAKVSVG
jgi:translation initiation factor 1